MRRRCFICDARLGDGGGWLELRLVSWERNRIVLQLCGTHGKNLVQAVSKASGKPYDVGELQVVG